MHELPGVEGCELRVQVKEELASIEEEAGSMKAAAPGAMMEFLKLQTVRTPCRPPRPASD